MQYTYYTLSALGFRVPHRVKRGLTTLQITQFVFGASFAALPLFLSYTFPVSVKYVTSELVEGPASTVAAVLSSDSVTAATAASTAAATALLKKLIYRAAGEEGLAENVPSPVAGAHEISHAPELQQVINQAIKKVFYRTQYKQTQCIDTTGRSFAVWLNLVYLFPLTMLFVRFFIKSYTRRSSSAKHPAKQSLITKAGMDAVHGVEREMESLTEAPGNVLNGTPSGSGTPVKSETDARGRGRDWEFNPVSIANSVVDRNQELVESFNKKVSDGLEKAKLNGKSTTQAAKEIASNIMSKGSTPKGKRSRDISSHKAQEPVKTEKAEKVDDDTAPKVEEPETVLAETKIEPLEEQNTEIEGLLVEKPEPAEEGLSTTDPNEVGIAYADMVKK